jgi:REP-associated tyrosine transposase
VRFLARSQRSEQVQNPKGFYISAQGKRSATLGRRQPYEPNPERVLQRYRRKMPQSLAKIHLHLIFSTKNRVPFLRDRQLRLDTHAYLAGACENLGSPALLIGGMEDHVHILCLMSRTITIAELLRDLKRESSKWLKARDADLAEFHWQDGYGAFSISPSHVDSVRTYIARQEEHHHQETYQDEYRRLLRKYAIEFDERFVWD